MTAAVAPASAVQSSVLHRNSDDRTRRAGHGLPIRIHRVDDGEHRERRDRRRDAAQAHEHAPEDIGDGAGENRRQQQRNGKRQLVVSDDVGQSAQREPLHRRRDGEPGRRIGAQAHESDLAETDHPGIADESVKADDDHHADEHLRDGARQRTAGEHRRSDGDDDKRGDENDRRRNRPGEQRRAGAHRQTLRLADLTANRPSGFNNSVTITAP